MLNKKFRLTDSKDFDTIYRKGRKFRGDFGMLILLSNPSDSSPPKFGFVVGKKIGNAVKRNLHVRRLRAIVKEFLEENGYESLNGSMFSYISHKEAPSFQELKVELFKQLNEGIESTRSTNK